MQSKGKQRRREINTARTELLKSTVMCMTFRSSAPLEKITEQYYVDNKTATPTRSDKIASFTTIFYRMPKQFNSPKFTQTKFHNQIYARVHSILTESTVAKGEWTGNDSSESLDQPNSNKTLHFSMTYTIRTYKCECGLYQMHTVNIHLHCTIWSTLCETSDNIMVKYKQQTVETRYKTVDLKGNENHT